MDLNQALKEARDNRPELRRLNLQDEITDIDLKFFKNQTRPQVDLVGTVASTGLAGTAAATLPPGTLVPLISGDPTLVANAFPEPDSGHSAPGSLSRSYFTIG